VWDFTTAPLGSYDIGPAFARTGAAGLRLSQVNDTVTGARAVTYTERTLDGPVTANSELTYSFKVQQQPKMKGCALWVTLIDVCGGGACNPTVSITPSDIASTTARFYRFCVNKMDAFGKDCDELVDAPLQQWTRHSWNVLDKFRAKYGPSVTLSKLKVQFAVYGGSTTFTYDHDSFEDGAGSGDDWNSRNGRNPTIQCNDPANPAYAGNCAQYQAGSYGRNFEQTNQNFEDGQPTSGYVAGEYPMMCSAYRFQDGTHKANMLVRVRSVVHTPNANTGIPSTSYKEDWYTIDWNSCPTSNEATGSAPGCSWQYKYGATMGSMVADGNWHYKCVDINAQLQMSIGPGTHTVRSMIWHSSNRAMNTANMRFWIDEFSVRSVPVYDTAETWIDDVALRTVTDAAMTRQCPRLAASALFDDPAGSATRVAAGAAVDNSLASDSAQVLLVDARTHAVEAGYPKTFATSGAAGDAQTIALAQELEAVPAGKVVVVASAHAEAGSTELLNEDFSGLGIYENAQVFPQLELRYADASAAAVAAAAAARAAAGEPGAPAAAETRVNVAFGKPATQSSRVHFQGSAQRAVDGGKYCLWGDMSVTHTGYAEDYPNLNIEVGHGHLDAAGAPAPVNIDTVKVWRRSDTMESSMYQVDKGIQVRVGGRVWQDATMCGTGPRAFASSGVRETHLSFDCGGLTGQFVHVVGNWKSSTGTNKYLQLCEVEAFATAPASAPLRANVFSSGMFLTAQTKGTDGSAVPFTYSTSAAAGAAGVPIDAAGRGAMNAHEAGGLLRISATAALAPATTAGLPVGVPVGLAFAGSDTIRLSAPTFLNSGGMKCGRVTARAPGAPGTSEQHVSCDPQSTTHGCCDYSYGSWGYCGNNPSMCDCPACSDQRAYALSTLPVSADTFIDATAPSTPQSSALTPATASFFGRVGNSAATEKRALLKFDAAAARAQAAGRRIKTATLKMYTSYAGGRRTGVTHWRGYAMTEAWSENTATWDLHSAGHNTSDVLFNWQYSPSNGWGRSTDTYRWYSYNYDGQGLTQAVQRWIDDPATNFGMAVAPVTTRGSGDTFAGITSKEGATLDYLTPQIEVVWEADATPPTAAEEAAAAPQHGFAHDPAGVGASVRTLAVVTPSKCAQACDLETTCAGWALQLASMLCTLQAPPVGAAAISDPPVVSEGYMCGVPLRKRAGTDGLTPDVSGSSKWTMDFWIRTPLARNGQELYTVVGSKDGIESQLSFKRTCATNEDTALDGAAIRVEASGAASAAACCTACVQEAACRAWTFEAAAAAGATCTLRSAAGTSTATLGVTSGTSGEVLVGAVSNGGFIAWNSSATARLETDLPAPARRLWPLSADGWHRFTVRVMPSSTQYPVGYQLVHVDGADFSQTPVSADTLVGAPAIPTVGLIGRVIKSGMFAVGNNAAAYRDASAQAAIGDLAGFRLYSAISFPPSLLQDGGYRSWLQFNEGEGSDGVASKYSVYRGQVQQGQWVRESGGYAGRRPNDRIYRERPNSFGQFGLGDGTQARFRRGSYVLHSAADALAWADVDIYTHVRADTSTNGMGVMFRVQSSSSYYRLVLAKFGSSSALELERLQGGVYSLLARTTNWQFDRGTGYIVRVRAVGGAFSVFIDGMLQLTATDAAPMKTGTVGLFTWDSYNSKFDSVRVSTVPTAGAASEESSERLQAAVVSVGGTAQSAALTQDGGRWTLLGARATVADAATGVRNATAAARSMHLAARGVGPSAAAELFPCRVTERSVNENAPVGTAVGGLLRVATGFGGAQRYRVARRRPAGATPTLAAGALPPPSALAVDHFTGELSVRGCGFSGVVRDMAGSDVGTVALAAPAPAPVGAAGGAVLEHQARQAAAADSACCAACSALSACEFWVQDAPADAALAPTCYLKKDFGGYISHATRRGNFKSEAPAAFNYEASTLDSATVLARRAGYDTGWFHMASQAGVDSYKTVPHGIVIGASTSAATAAPAGSVESLLTRVVTKAIDGPNEGFSFPGMGAAGMDGKDWSNSYGGLLFAVSPTQVRLWAPSNSVGYRDTHEDHEPSIIRVGYGYGGTYDAVTGAAIGEPKAQSSHHAMARVRVCEDSPPAYDSGWFAMRSGESGSSFTEVRHGIGRRPARVKVIARATAGANAGFAFVASGAQNIDDDAYVPNDGDYGGLVYGYSNMSVRVWAPDATSSDALRQPGHIIYVGNGWGGEVNSQIEDAAEVRVLAFDEHDEDVPDFDSGWVEVASNAAPGYHELEHGLGQEPENVQVQLRVETGENMNFIFEGIGAAQAKSKSSHKDYAGVLYGWSDSKIRIFPASPNTRGGMTTRSNYACIVQAGRDGWGGNRHSQCVKTALMRVRAWKSHGCATDATTVELGVKDVNEAPELSEISASVREDIVTGTLIASMSGRDDDFGQTLMYSIQSAKGVAGGVEAADGSTVLDTIPLHQLPFAVDEATGVVTSSRELDFETTALYELTMAASDSVLVTTALLTVTVRNVNDRPVMDPAVFEIIEDSPVNANVGVALNGTDGDIDQTALFTIADDGGNVDGAFKVSGCGGQIRVARAVIDYERISQYNLTMVLTDDGRPPLNTTAVITINVMNKNDPPIFPNQAIDVTENGALGEPVSGMADGAIGNETLSDGVEARARAAMSAGSLLIVDPDSDTVHCAITRGNEAGLFAMQNVTNGQGAGIGGCALIAAEGAPVSPDYELPAVAPTYTLEVTVTDTGTPPLVTTGSVMVQILNANDAPVFPAVVSRAIGEVVSLGTRSRLVDEDLGGDTGGGMDPDAEGDDSDAVDPGMDDGTGTGLNVTDNGSGGATAAVVPPAWSVLGMPIAASDQDSRACSGAVGESVWCADALSYSLLAVYGWGFVNGSLPSALAASPPTHPFRIDSATGQLWVNASVTLDFETANSYVATVRATDSFGLPIDVNVTVAVLDLNDPPLINDVALSVAENQRVSTVLGDLSVLGGASDPDGDTLTYAIAGGNSAGIFSVSSAGLLTLAKAELDFESRPVHELTVTVTDDGQPAMQTTAALTVTLLDQNDAPAATCDPTITDTWTDAAGSNAVLGLTTNGVGPDNMAVADGLRTVNYGLFAAEADCRAACGADMRCVAYTLFAAGYHDARFAGGCYGRTAAAGAAPMVNEDPTGVVVRSGLKTTPCFTVPAFAENPAAGDDLSLVMVVVDADAGASLTASLVAGSGSSCPTQADVLNEPRETRWMRFDCPACDCGCSRPSPAAWDVADGPICLRQTVRQLSPEVASAFELTFSAAGVGGGTALALGLRVSSNASAALAAFDFERIGGSALFVGIRVTDAGSPTPLQTVFTVSVVLTDVNEPPVFAPATAAVSIAFAPRSLPGAPAFIGPPLAALDPEVADVLTYSIGSVSSKDGAPLTGLIGLEQGAAGRTARLFLQSALAFDAVQTISPLTVLLTVSDAVNAPASAGVVSIELVEHNFEPVLDSVALSLPETGAGSARAGDTVVALVATDANPADNHTYEILGSAEEAAGLPFVLHANGSLMLTRALDFESTASWAFSVLVTDSGPGNLQGVGEVTVTVLDVNEPPAVPSMTSLSVDENSPVGTKVGANGAGLRIDCPDPEDNTVTFSIVATSPAPAGGPVFTVTGAVDARGAYALIEVARPDALDFESTLHSFNLTLTATDQSGASSSGLLKVFVLDVNEPPAMTCTPITLAEGAGPATLFDSATSDILASAVSAVDPEGSALLYAIDDLAGSGSAFGSGNGKFALAPTTGELELVQAMDGAGTAVLDYETRAVFNLTVRATDPSQATGECHLLVFVTDVNDLTVSAAAVGALSTSDMLTAGAEELRITGTNFGPAVHSGGTAVAVTYSTELVTGARRTLTATSCAVAAGGNTLITCSTVEGAGYGPYQLEVTIGSPAAASSMVVPPAGWRNATANETVLSPGIWSARASSAVALHYRRPAVISLQVTLATAAAAAAADAAAAAADTGFPQRASARQLSTVGGDAITLVGSDFGAVGTVVGASAFSAALPGRPLVATECVVAVAHTHVVCTTAAGAGGQLTWTVVVDAQQSESKAGLGSAYAPPRVTGLDNSTALQTAGSDVVTLTGHGFGPMGYGYVVAAAFGRPLTASALAAAAVAASANGGAVPLAPDQLFRDGLFYTAACEVTVAHTTVLCTVPEGVGTGHEWRLTVGATPSAIAPGAGTPAVAPVVVVGGDTDAQGNIAIDGQRSLAPSFNRTSFRAPVLQAVVGPGTHNANTQGGQLLTVRGTQLGPMLTVVRVSYGKRYRYTAPTAEFPEGRTELEFIAAGCRVTVAHSQLECLTAPGTGTGHSWGVLVGGQQSEDLYTGSSYGAPFVSVLQGVGSLDAGTPGQQSVQIKGGNFGTQSMGRLDNVTYGPTGTEFTALNCTVAQSHLMIACNTAPGGGAGLKWVVNVDNQRSTQPTTNYAPPAVAALAGVGATAARSVGGDVVVLTGTNFATQAQLGAVTYGWSGPPGEYQAADCNVSVPHQELRCRTAPGWGAGLAWFVKVAGQSNSYSNAVAARSSYSPPQIVTVDPDSGPTAGGVPMLITGTNFGPRGMAAVTVGGQTVPVNRHLIAASGDSHTLLVTVPQGFGRNRSVKVVLGGAASNTPSQRLRAQPSNAVAFDYNAPNITKLVVRRESGSQLLLNLFGSGFGTEYDPKNGGRTAAVLIDGAPTIAACTAAPCYTHSEVSVLYGGGTVQPNASGVPADGADGVSGSVRVVVGESSFFDAVSGGLQTLAQALADPLHNAQASNTVYFTHESPDISTWSWCDAANGPLRFAPVTGNILNCPASPAKPPTRGGGFLVVNGQYFGTEPVVLVGGKLCTHVDPLNPTEQLDPSCVSASGSCAQRIVCLLPAGSGTAEFLIVLGGMSSLSKYIQYQTPLWELTSLNAVPTEGGAVHLVGENLGLLSQLLLNGFHLSISARGHSFVNATFPPGEGTGHTLTLIDYTSALQADYSVPFAYQLPAVASMEGAAADDTGVPGALANTDGTTLLTLTGSSFGSPAVYAWQTALLGDDTWVGAMYSKQINGQIVPTWALAVLAGSGGQNATGNATAAAESASAASAAATHSVAFFPRYQQETWSRAVPGQVGCAMVEWSHSRIVCRVGEGAGAGLITRVIAGTGADALAADAPELFSFLKPQVFAVAPPHGSTRGGGVVRVLGRNLGAGSPANQATNISVIFGSSTHRVTTFCAESATAAAFDSLVAAGDSTAGFGEGCIINQTHAHVDLRLPEDDGTAYPARQPVAVSVGGQPSTANTSVVFEYNAPNITGVFPRSSATDGREENPAPGQSAQWLPVTISGSGFGTSSDFEVLLGHRSEWPFLNCGDSFKKCAFRQCGVGVLLVPPCIVTHSHNEIVALMGAGIGANLDLQVRIKPSGVAREDDANWRRSAASAQSTFSFSPPTINSFHPNVPSAVGELVSITGRNFGSSASPVELLIDGKACIDAQWRCCDARGAPKIICTTPEVRAGYKNVTLTVANQTVSYFTGDALMQAACKPGYYGQMGEYCLKCPRGAICDSVFNGDNYTEPESLTGWWRMSLPMPNDLCPSERQARPEGYETCSTFVPCEPAEACTGENICTVGYAGERCSKCALGYYKRQGGCVSCPECPACMYLLFLGVGALASAVGYILNKKQVELGILSIGVDYFQVLTMVGRTRVGWPPAVVELMHYLSAFNLNLEILAPECSYPDLAFETKWLFIEFMPVFFFLMVLAVYFAQYFKKRFILQRTAKLHNHGHRVVGMSLLCFYYLYLYLSRNTLEIFNCQPTDPPDGHEYMEAVFERCYEPGGLQLKLLGPALIFFGLYTLSYPCFVASVLLRNRLLAQEDQLLRAQETGKTRSSNPNCYDFRKRYHKLYYQFKPQHYYWILVIIGRKFMIAVAGLMWRKTPAFQLAIMLLVMFVSYALQVRHQPYMSNSEKAAVVLKWQTEAEAQDTVSLDKVGIFNAQDKGGGPKRGAGKRGSVAQGKPTASSRLEAYRAAKKQRLNQHPAAYFWNYNTVEATLLCCAVLVTLAGVMFQSDRLETQGASAQGLAYLTIFVVVSSILYFFSVLTSEILIGTGVWRPKGTDGGKLEPNDPKGAEKKRRIITSDNSKGGNGGGAGGGAGAEEPVEFAQMMENTREVRKSLEGAGGSPAGGGTRLAAHGRQDTEGDDVVMNPLGGLVAGKEDNKFKKQIRDLLDEREEMELAMTQLSEELLLAKKAAATSRVEARGARASKSGRAVLDGGSSARGKKKEAKARKGFGSADRSDSARTLRTPSSVEHFGGADADADESMQYGANPLAPGGQ
jgi:hypothetical protein